MEDGSVAVDLPNLGTQHVIILTEWRFTETVPSLSQKLVAISGCWRMKSRFSLGMWELEGWGWGDGFHQNALYAL